MDDQMLAEAGSILQFNVTQAGENVLLRGLVREARASIDYLKSCVLDKSLIPGWLDDWDKRADALLGKEEPR